MRRAWYSMAVGLAGVIVILTATVPRGQTSLQPRQAGPGGDDPVAVLAARIAAGEVTIAAEGEHGYLGGLLTALDIPVSSQGLVFSRTSLQTDRIGPWAPRALYFNDDVYVAEVQGSPFLEIASIDPDEGAYFYTVNQDGGGRPVFERQTTTCLMCHESKAVTGGVPGVIVRSVLTDRLGYVIGSVHEGAVTDRTPFDRRFGGYYVTGTREPTSHAGNTLSPLLSHEVRRRDEYVRTFDRTSGLVTDLSDRFDVARYLTPHSDVVALLVLAHQASVHNLITQAHQAATEVPATDHRIDGAVDRLLREMLFSQEAPLGGSIDGTSAYARDFVSRGPRDSLGRSLRDFDLEDRLFRYPLSFLIYSDAFAALPPVIQQRFHARLDAVLAGADPDPRFGHLSPADRADIRAILEGTGR